MATNDYVLIRPTTHVLKEYFFCILSLLTRLVSLISTKTIGYFSWSPFMQSVYTTTNTKCPNISTQKVWSCLFGCNKIGHAYNKIINWMPESQLFCCKPDQFIKVLCKNWVFKPQWVVRCKIKELFNILQEWGSLDTSQNKVRGAGAEKHECISPSL